MLDCEMFEALSWLNQSPEKGQARSWEWLQIELLQEMLETGYDCIVRWIPEQKQYVLLLTDVTVETSQVFCNGMFDTYVVED